MSQDYNPKKARTKYACPIWVDAFVRDTMDLAADEFGAYHLILYAMWSREELNMPDDDRKLARLARCSQKMWRARIRPALEPFFDVENGYWTNVRLTKEATKTEKFLRDQSDRKRGSENSGNAAAFPEGTQQEADSSDINSYKSLKNNDQDATTETTADHSGEQPTQETKSPSIKEPPLAPPGGREKEIINFPRKPRTQGREQEAMLRAKEILRSKEAKRDADDQ